MKKINTNIFLKNRPISDLPNRLNDTVYFDPEKSGNEALKGNIKNNFNVGLLLGILFCLILIYKLFFLQIEEGLANFRIAEGNRTRSIMSPAPRGLIVDEGGEPIVKNESSYQLVCHINKKADLERVDQKVFDLIELDKDTHECTSELPQNRRKIINSFLIIGHFLAESSPLKQHCP